MNIPSTPRLVGLPRTRRIALWLVIVLAVTTVSCSKPQPQDQYDYSRITLDGQTTLGISKKDTIIRGVVVFFHDVGANEFALTSDQSHSQLTSAIVNAGFALVASSAGGDAFGSSGSQRNYVYLGGAAVAHYGTENIFFLADGMGALAAMALLAAHLTQRVRGIAAINPLLDLATAAPQYRGAINQLSQDQSLEAISPVNLAPDELRGQRMRFYVSPDDSYAPAAANAHAFAERFGSVADISIVDCSGGHADKSCYQGDDIVKWFTRLESRTTS